MCKDGFRVLCRPQAATFNMSFSASDYAPGCIIIVSLVLSRLDYGNAVLAGLPAYLFRRLQSVMNAAARLIYGQRHSDHIISNALISLHWFRAQGRLRFQKAVLIYKATHGNAPSTGLCRRSTWSTLPPLCLDQSSAGAVHQTVYRWRPGLPSRRTHHLEQSAGQCALCSVVVDVSSASENIFVPGLVL